MDLGDPRGLTAQDVVIIDEYIRQNFGDIKRRGGYEFGKPNEGASASTAPLSGVTTLEESIRCKRLSQEDFYGLFKTMLHESMHSTDPWWRVAIDARAQPKLTENHQAIINRTSYETVIGHRFIPDGPKMWGNPTGFVPKVDDLYNRTRDQGNKMCGCE